MVSFEDLTNLMRRKLDEQAQRADGGAERRKRAARRAPAQRASKRPRPRPRRLLRHREGQQQQRSMGSADGQESDSGSEPSEGESWENSEGEGEDVTLAQRAQQLRGLKSVAGGGGSPGRRGQGQRGPRQLPRREECPKPSQPGPAPTPGGLCKRSGRC